MAGSIRGITIEINGDTSNLSQSLRTVDRDTQRIQNELRQVDRLLKFDPSNVDLLAQRQQLLGNAVQSTTQRLDTLRQAQSQVEQQFANGEIGEEAFRAFQREIIATEGRLNSFAQRAENTAIRIETTVDANGINQLRNAITDLGTEAARVGRQVGSSLSTGATAATVGIGALVVGSTDLNNDLARLRTNADLTGRDFGTLENALTQIVSVTGEADSAVETLSNLLASGLSDEQLSSAINNITGAAIRFSDTLNTEGIADGFQETIASGSDATGQFAELLERSGVNIDDFNDRLAGASNQSERANIALEQLSSLGLTDVATRYNELNGELVENNESTFEFQQALAELAIALTPLIIIVTNFITRLVNWASENETLARTFAIVSGAIVAISTVIRILQPIVSTAITLFTRIRNVISAARVVFLAFAGPIGVIVAVVTALVTAGIALYRNWETVGPFLAQVWTNIQNIASVVFTAIANRITSTFNTIRNSATSIWNSITSFFSRSVSRQREIFSNGFNAIRTNVSNAVTRTREIALSAFSAIQQGVSSRVSNLVSTVRQLPGQIINAIGNLATRTFNIGRDVVNGLINGITSRIRDLVSKAREIGNIVEEGIRNRLQTRSPSKVTFAVGEDTGDGFINGLDSTARRLANSARNIGSIAANAGGVLDDSRLRGQQQRAVQQSVQQRSQNIDLSGLVNAVVQLANNQPDVKLFLDGREVATVVDRQQYNSAALAGLTRGVTI